MFYSKINKMALEEKPLFMSISFVVLVVDKTWIECTEESESPVYNTKRSVSAN